MNYTEFLADVSIEGAAAATCAVVPFVGTEWAIVAGLIWVLGFLMLLSAVFNVCLTSAIFLLSALVHLGICWRDKHNLWSWLKRDLPDKETDDGKKEKG